MARETADRDPNLRETAQACVQIALKKGAKEASARAYRDRDVTVEWRDGRVEQIKEATTRGVTVQLFADGRYTVVSSSDLRREALGAVIGDSLAMARALAPDPHRYLPEPALYAGQATIDLQIEDPRYSSVTAEQRRSLAREMEEAARSVKGAEAILSVTTGFNDTRSDVVRVHSNGFEGARADTAFWTYATVSVKDADGRRPEDWSAAGVRFVGDLSTVANDGRRAAERALSRIGAKKGDSAVLPMAVDARAAGRMAGALIDPLSARSLQQKRSFLEGKLGTAIGNERLTFGDDPHLVKGFGSRLFDNEGLAARPIPIFEGGVLKSYYVDTYYGRKLEMRPTTGSPSNLSWKLGEKSPAQLLADMKDGILVTSFLGGNSNGTTGDFSYGIAGFRVRDGRAAEPVSEMNIAGNLGTLFQRLVAVGNDPYPYSPLRTPTLVFDGVQFAGN